MLSKAEKKQYGIYFTPPEIISEMINNIDFDNISSVLEPSCGDGRFISSILSKSPTMYVIGVELNDIVFDNLSETTNFPPNVTILNDDFIHCDFDDETFDLIIGNPPYFVVGKSTIDKKYHPFIVGRPNIYIVFILKCLELLSEDGILMFVLPTNFLNSHYYDKARKHICSNYTISAVIECNAECNDTKQKICYMEIVNRTSDANEEFVTDIGGYTIISSHINTIKRLLIDSTTLDKLGFKVSVGTVVWNQVKSELTDDSSRTLLIYSSDICDGELSIKHYKNGAKKNYINRRGEGGPLLVINRGYGVSTYKFSYCLIDITGEYLTENHLICVRDKSGRSAEDLHNMYNSIINSFEDPRTSEFITVYFKNNAINTTELQYILPIYL